MTEFRSRILQSKRYESSLIATSRKRKLRELYAVADCDGPIPLNWVVADTEHPQPALAPTPTETQFLEKNDILQHRLFDESSLPTRRQLQSYAAKGLFTGRRGVTSQTSDPSRLSSKASCDDGPGKSRGNTPAKESAVGTTNGSPRVTERSRRGRSATHAAENTTTGLRRTSSRSSQTKFLTSPDGIPVSSTDESKADGTQPLPATQEEELEVGIVEEERIENEVESRPGSPGIDPRKALQFSAEDEANLTGLLIIGSHEEGHKAVTAHLPPPEIQEDHLREVDEREAENGARQEKDGVSGSLSIKLPPPHNGRPLGDPMSSPGSTIDAHSATTPALHDASTDTSPDNEGLRYEADRSDDKEPDPETPPELAPSREEALEKEKHDRLLKAQIELARSEILAGSPTTADAQLRLEEEQAAAASAGEAEREIPDSERSGAESSQEASPENIQSSQSGSRNMTQSAVELVQDIMDDEDDEVVGVPTPEDEKVPDSETGAKSPRNMVPQGDEDAMDVDSAVAGDGFQNDASKATSRAPAALVVSEEVTNSSEKPSVQHKDAPSVSTSTPPRRTPSGPSPTSPTLERMTTRVSSGAMRHKSVSEILGEIPKPNTISAAERNMTAKPVADTESATGSISHSRATTPQSPASRMRTMVERAKEKERSKLSTVIFAKQPADRPSSKSALVPSNARAHTHESGDYFIPLILSQVYNATRGVQPLEALLMSAHKTITTSNSYIPYQEHQSHKVLRRIHSLQSQDKWSFRQPKRSPEPNRPTAHWDELLKEAKWMRTDFREERKWKLAVARNLARACAEWVEADEDDRRQLQLKTIIPVVEPIQTQDDATSTIEASHPTPELENSAENDSQIEDFDEEPRASLLDAVAPTAMFSLGDDDVVFGLSRSPATDKLLEELPMYGVPLKVPQSELPTSEMDPDASWRRPALPLSKYVEGKIVLRDDGPPRKRSRYEYEQEDDDDQIVFGSQGSSRVHLEPAMLDVALFNPENKHIRDRIHAGHQFRPPSENPMPMQSFFECRSSSQWTWAEDDELKTLVREYSYNWQLISSMLSTRSMFASSAERRTPWECFERWIHLEGLPADMQKTHYFRAYNNRLEAARGNVLAQAAQPPPQANSAGAAITPVRRRTTTSVRVERRRNQKHLTLVDAMRKLAKKRETSLQKQQHAAGLAAMRKANEAPQPQGARHTPQDFSRLKHEREIQMMERIQRHQMQQEAAKRQAMQQGRNGQQPNPQQFPNGVPQQARNIANPNAGAPINLPPNSNRPSQLAVPGQNLPHAQMQQLPNTMAAQVPLQNGLATMPQLPIKGVPQAPMQAMPSMPGMQGMPPQHRMPAPNGTPDLRLVMQARQISEQQRQAVQLQQQGQKNQIHNSPPNMRANMNMSNMNNQAFMQNSQALMAAFNAGNMNGIGTPPSNGLNVPSAGPAASPRMGHPSQPQQSNGSASQLNKLESQFRAQFPTASPEQIKKLVQDTLSQSLAAQRQSAMHAAAGSGPALDGMPGGLQNSPQQYAQMLRAQQGRQAATLSQQPRSTSSGSGSGSGMGK